MPVDASHDDVKRAYLDGMLRFQPGRMTDESPDALEKAAFRRTELSDAWAVLRNPAARARYDDDLRAEAEDAAFGRSAGGGAATALATAPVVVEHRAPTSADRPMLPLLERSTDKRRRRRKDEAPWVAREREAAAVRATEIAPQGATALELVDATSGSALAPRPSSREPWRPKSIVNPFDPRDEEPAELEAADTQTKAPPPRRIQWAPAIVGGAVLVVVLVAAAIGMRKPSDQLNISTVERFGVGTCVAEAGPGQVGTVHVSAGLVQQIVSVDCAEPNLGQVVARVDFPLPCPTGRAMVLVDVNQSVCIMSVAKAKTLPSTTVPASGH